MKKSFSVKEIVTIGLIIAFTYVGLLIKIPVVTGTIIQIAYIILFATAICFGGLKSGIGCGLGAFLSDVTSPYAAFAPFSLVIWFIVGFVSGKLLEKNNFNYKKAIFVCILGSLIGIIGYFFTDVLILGSIAPALASVLTEIVNSVVGVAAGIPLGFFLKNKLVVKFNYIKKIIKKPH